MIVDKRTIKENKTKNIVESLKELKEVVEILGKAIVEKADAELVEKLKTKEGLVEYLKEKRDELKEEGFYILTEGELKNIESELKEKFENEIKEKIEEEIKEMIEKKEIATREMIESELKELLEEGIITINENNEEDGDKDDEKDEEEKDKEDKKEKDKEDKKEESFLFEKILDIVEKEESGVFEESQEYGSLIDRIIS